GALGAGSRPARVPSACSHGALTSKAGCLSSARPLALSTRECQQSLTGPRKGPRMEDSTMGIRPLQDRVLVKRLKEEEKTKGGIIMPDTAKEKPIEGEVIAVGNGKVTEKGEVRKLDVKKGDRILFGKYSGTEVKIDGEEHLILREDDILGVVT